MTKSDAPEPVWHRREIDSPCVKICVVHPQARICTGCYRTIEEISGWSRMPEAERQALMKTLPDRASMLRKRRGGRQARLAGS